MAFKLSDGTGLPVNVPFSITDDKGETINYPANWLKLSSAEEKTALGITEVADAPRYDSRFYNVDGSSKALDDVNQVDENGDPVLDSYTGKQVVIYGVKTNLKNNEKKITSTLLGECDWYVTRKSEKGTAIPTEISTYRDAVRTANVTRESEIDACADTAALVTLYGYKEDGSPNITQYPTKPTV